jgi:hypothetical protein
MTEAESLEIVAIYIQNAHSAFSIYVTVTFSYLATAFFVGSKLKPYQAVVATGLYVYAAVSAILAEVANIQVWSAAASQSTVLNSVSLIDAELWIYMNTALMSFGVLASLYFMWQVTRPDAEPS